MPENHGWTHANDIDPIPGFPPTGGSGSRMWPTQVEFVLPHVFVAANLYPKNTFYATVENDTGQWHGYKLMNKNPGGGGSYVDAAVIYFGCRLGPKYSQWALTGHFQRNTDHGKLDFAFATAPEDDPVPYFTPITAAMGNPADTNYIPTWYTQPALENGTPTVDMYHTALENNYCVSIANFQILGDDGDRITGNATTAANTWGNGGAAFDGGSGIWWVRCKVNGKNASSSGYKCPITRLTLHRVTADPWGLH